MRKIFVRVLNYLSKIESSIEEKFKELYDGLVYYFLIEGEIPESLDSLQDINLINILSFYFSCFAL